MKKLVVYAVFVMSMMFLSSCAGKKALNYDANNFYEVCAYGKKSEIAKMLKRGNPVNKGITASQWLPCTEIILRFLKFLNLSPREKQILDLLEALPK